MKVICDQSALAEALGIVGSVVANRTPTPVLTCIKLTAEDGRLVLAATDGDVGLRLVLEQVEVDKPGETLIPADKLNQIVRECQDPTVTLESDKQALFIHSGESKFKIYGFDPAEAPPIKSFDDTSVDCEIQAKALLDLISRSLFAAADEHSRYAINGVLLDRKGTDIRMIATDGRRLAMACGTAISGSGDSNCIVPSKALGIMKRLLRSNDATVRLAVDEHQIHVHVDDGSEQATLSSSLVEGRFPPFEDVIPKDQDKKVVFNCNTLRAAVRQAALLTNEESRSVRMCFQNKSLVLTSHAPEMGEAEVHLDLPDYSGDDLEIGFNPNYLSDALKVIDEEQVVFELKADNKPGVLRSGKEFTYVLMPVNLS
jgi:DNA polymerase-3 subunit beta